MIRINVRVHDAAVQKVTVHGHGGGTEGKDILCAAVSAVVQMTLCGLLHYGKDHVDWEKKKGAITISLKKNIPPAVQSSLNTVLFTMLLGLQEIERSHPERVHLRIAPIP